MQSSNNRSNNNTTANRTSAESIKKKASLKKQQQPLKKPSLPRSIHVEPKKKKEWCKCDCFFFKPQNIFTALKTCYWLILSISLVPFIIGIIGSGYDGSDWYGSVPQVQRVVFPLYLTLSIIQAILCCWQISKIYGMEVSQKSPIVVLFLFSIAYIVLAIVGGFLFMKLYNDRYDYNSCLQNSNQLMNSYIQSDLNVATSNFCVKAQSCVCLIDNPSQFSQTVLSKLYYNTVGSGVTTALNCPNVNQYQLTSDGPNILQNLELKFQCSGICTAQPIYYFSNINRGPPKTESCYVVLMNQLEIISKIIQIPILVIAITMIILLITIIFAARQYIKDPECFEWRLASFQRHVTTQMQQQQSLMHSNSNPHIGGNTNNMNNSVMLANNNSSVVYINQASPSPDLAEQSELQNNSLLMQNNGSPSKKLTQSILLNNNMNESRQSPSNPNGILQKKVTILTPTSNKNAENNQYDPTVDIESSSKHNPRGKIQFIRVDSIKENDRYEKQNKTSKQQDE